MTISDPDLGSEEARRRLYDIMRQDAPVEEKVDRALALGKAYLDVDNGHLTRIDPTAEYWEVVESTDRPDGVYPVGLVCDLGDTYCRRTIRRDDPVAIHDAPNQGWADDPAFEKHSLYTYHGVAMEVGDAVYGTVCFVSRAPRDDPFTDDESMFADLIARLLGHAIERERYENTLTERNEMVNVLCRVLRHNLRNDVNVIQGHADLVRDYSPTDADDSIEIILDTIDDLTHLSDKAQQLSDLVSEPFDGQEIDIASLLRQLAREIEDAYPDASITVTSSTDTKIRAAPQLETAFRELLENAVKHSDPQPSVSVSIGTTQQAAQVRVMDDGPGLPAQEQDVLQNGDETPLNHGSGLGLWLVYWIITRHDGSIEAAVSDTGTTVTVTLPYGFHAGTITK